MRVVKRAFAVIGIIAMPGAAFQNALSFADFQVPPSQIFKGTPAIPQFKTAGQRQFRTRIREAEGKGAEFAGHYVIAQWGCGSGCVQMAVVDLQSGDVFDGPFGVLPKARISSGAADNAGLEYHADSRLLIARGCPNETEKACGTYYYEWTGREFKLLRQAPL